LIKNTTSIKYTCYVNDRYFKRWDKLLPACSFMGGGYGDKAPKEDPFRWERRGEIDANRWRRPIFFIQPLEDHSCGQSELWQPGICDPDNPHSTRFKHGESYRSRVRLVRTERPDRNWWTAALMVYKTVTIFPRPRGWLSTRAMISGHKILNGRIVDQQAYNLPHSDGCISACTFPAW
jgi:hypothetical protein